MEASPASTSGGEAGRGQRCQTTAYNPALDVNVDCVVEQTDERAVSKVIGTAVTETQPKVHQGAALAIAPTSGHVYLAWRQFGLGVDTDPIFHLESTDGGSDLFGRRRSFRRCAVRSRDDQHHVSNERVSVAGDR